jgi:hypothetical protein
VHQNQYCNVVVGEKLQSPQFMHDSSGDARNSRATQAFKKKKYRLYRTYIEKIQEFTEHKRELQDIPASL